MVIRALIDLNVILDVLQNRQPFFTDSAKALVLAEKGEIEGAVAAHSLTTLYYLYAKSHSSQLARSATSELLQFLTVASVGHSTFVRALSLPLSDFEDAVQMAAAMDVGAEYIVTRNLKDFQDGPLPAIQPGELANLIHLG